MFIFVCLCWLAFFVAGLCSYSFAFVGLHLLLLVCVHIHRQCALYGHHRSPQKSHMEGDEIKNCKIHLRKTKKAAQVENNADFSSLGFGSVRLQGPGFSVVSINWQEVVVKYQKALMKSAAPSYFKKF